ncbi:MAG: chloride channel protein [Gemmatimonadetes bacterium]|nr:chloride channel protein [Gemmatimonadota bacterium]
MSISVRDLVARFRSYLRGDGGSLELPLLSDESRWYTEHTALLVTTVKWAFLGAAAGVCVGLGTRGFLWSIEWSGAYVISLTGGAFPVWVLLPIGLPVCAWIVRTFSPEARGHGTEAVITAVHQRSGRVQWRVAPVKLVATVLTLSLGGSVGKEGPAAQIGAALTSLFADLMRLVDADRRRLVICGISAGFAAVFGTPVSGALFGIEVLYLGKIDYGVIFPALIAGIVAHLVCGTSPPFGDLPDVLASIGQFKMIMVALASGVIFGLVALTLIETMRATERAARRFADHPYLVAMVGGSILAATYAVAGDAYAGLGTATVEGLLNGTLQVAVFAFLIKIVTTAVTLETGGSGGVLTPIFFVGAASGATIAPLFGVPASLLSAYGFVAVLGAATNTPIAAAVMAIEVLPSSEAVYAALAGVTAFLMVGHRSVYASQKLGFAKSAGLDVALGGTLGEVDISAARLRKGSIEERVHNIARSIEVEIDEVTGQGRPPRE